MKCSMQQWGGFLRRRKYIRRCKCSLIYVIRKNNEDNYLYTAYNPVEYHILIKQ